MGTRRSAALGGGLVGALLAAGLLFPCLAGKAVPALMDLPDFFWPMKAYTAARWAAGSVALWNPLSGCGEPWLAQLQTGVFYPGDLVFLLPWPFGPLAGIALHIVIAAAGMAAWLDHLETSRPASLAGAIVYAGGGAFLSLFPVYNNACTAAWLPWVFLGARRLVLGEGVTGLAASSALAFLAGEPVLAAAGTLGAAVLAFATREEGERGVPPLSHTLPRVIGGLLLAAGLTAVTALPFISLLVQNERLTNVRVDEALARPVKSGDVADLMLPPRQDVALRAAPDRGGYLVSLALGPAAFLLAAGAVAGFPGRRRFLSLLGLGGGLAFLLSLGAGGHLARFLYEIGLLRGLRFPARWVVFVQLCLAVAAAAGLDGWLHGRFRSDRAADEAVEGEVVPVDEERALRAARLFAVCALAGSAVLFFLAVAAQIRSGSRDLTRALVVGAAAVLIAGLLLLGRFRGGVWQRVATGGVPALLLASLAVVARDPLRSAPARSLVDRPRLYAELPAGSPGRIFAAVSDRFILSRWSAGEGWNEDAARRGLLALAGYSNLKLGLATSTSASPIANPRRVRLAGAALSGGNAAEVLGLMDVRHVISPFPAVIPGARLTGQADGVLRYDLTTAVGRVFFAREARVVSDDAAFDEIKKPGFSPEAAALLAEAPGQLPPARSGRSFTVAKVLTDAPEELEVATATSVAAVVVITRSYDPGWTATIDGAATKAVRADLNFTALVVPAGEHRVRLRYRPLSFRVGAVVSGASLVVLAVLFLAGAPVRRT